MNAIIQLISGFWRFIWDILSFKLQKEQKRLQEIAAKQQQELEKQKPKKRKLFGR